MGKIFTKKEIKETLNIILFGMNHGIPMKQISKTLGKNGNYAGNFLDKYWIVALEAKRRKEQFIKELRKTPIVQAVCNKLDISRNTFYRWKNEYPDFALEANEALFEGEETLNDIAEGNVAKSVAQGDLKSCKWWLEHRHPKFRRPYRPPKEELKPLFPDADKIRKFEQEWFEHDTKDVQVPKEVESKEIKPSSSDQ